jgi:hypothetical protein
MSELRSRQGGNVDFSQETSISRQEVAIVQSRLPGEVVLHVIRFSKTFRFGVRWVDWVGKPFTLYLVQKLLVSNKEKNVVRMMLSL